MKIGFDVSQVGKAKSGCGYFAHGLIHSLVELPTDIAYDLYLSFGDFYFDSQVANTFSKGQPRIERRLRHPTREAAAAFWGAADLEKNLGKVDLVHSNNFWCPRQLRGTRLIYTLYDMSFAENPAWTTEANRVGCFHGVFGAAATADWIVSISHASRAHFLRLFPSFPAERVKVIYPGLRFNDVRPEGTRPKMLGAVQPHRFWLSVGTLEPRKNHMRLLEAYARYAAYSKTSMPLVLAGGKGWLMDDFSKWVLSLGIADRVIVTDYVSDDELFWLYKHCYANVYVSLFEGFGLPVLEGMAFGAATIASNATSIPEITGQAAMLVDPLDTAALEYAFVTLGEDDRMRAELSNLGRQQACRFLWEDSAKQTVELYYLAARSPKRVANSPGVISPK